MSNIRYFASPILETAINRTERNKEIPLDYCMSIPDGCLQCYDIDRGRAIGILYFHRGLDNIPYICDEAVRDFFKVFDKTLEMDFELTSDKFHREVYIPTTKPI